MAWPTVSLKTVVVAALAGLSTAMPATNIKVQDPESPSGYLKARSPSAGSIESFSSELKHHNYPARDNGAMSHIDEPEKPTTNNWEMPNRIDARGIPVKYPLPGDDSFGGRRIIPLLKFPLPDDDNSAMGHVDEPEQPATDERATPSRIDARRYPLIDYPPREQPNGATVYLDEPEEPATDKLPNSIDARRYPLIDYPPRKQNNSATGHVDEPEKPVTDKVAMPTTVEILQVQPPREHAAGTMGHIDEPEKPATHDWVMPSEVDARRIQLHKYPPREQDGLRDHTKELLPHDMWPDDQPPNEIPIKPYDQHFHWFINVPDEYVINLPVSRTRHYFTAVTADRQHRGFYRMANNTEADTSGLEIKSVGRGFSSFKGYRTFNMTELREIKGLQFWDLVVVTKKGWFKHEDHYIAKGATWTPEYPAQGKDNLKLLAKFRRITDKVMPKLPCKDAANNCTAPNKAKNVPKPSKTKTPRPAKTSAAIKLPPFSNTTVATNVTTCIPTNITTVNVTATNITTNLSTRNVTTTDVNTRNTSDSTEGSSLFSSLRKLVPDRGIRTQYDTHITLVNATPYRWRRGYNHTHQVQGWHKWPQYIEPGASFQMLASIGQVWIQSNSAAEVAYHLEGTTKPMSFMVQFRSGINHQIYIEYLEELKSVANDKGSEHKLGWSYYPGGVGFVLSGTEDHLYGSDAPITWMQSMIDMIGDLPLREIAMPRSHNAGMYKSSGTVGFGNKFATQTQRIKVFDQLLVGGARVLDFRTAKSGGDFYTGHGAFVLGSWNGQLGAKFYDMISDINRFNDMYPGELIIVDVHPFETWNAKKRFRPLNVEEREEAFKALKRLRHRAVLPENVDITKWTLNDFVGNGTSSVIVRIDSSWLVDGARFPGSYEGFVTEVSFPTNTHWSNTGDSHKLVEDQLAILPMARPSRQAPIYNADWIITLQGLGAAIPIWSLLEIAGMAWRDVYHQFWDAMTDVTYPNWITLDDLSHDGGKTLVMAINQCLAARKCGSLGGKVTAPIVTSGKTKAKGGKAQTN